MSDGANASRTHHLTPAEFDELRNDHEAFCHRAGRTPHHRRRRHGPKHHRHGLHLGRDEVGATPAEGGELDQGGWDVGGFERPF